MFFVPSEPRILKDHYLDLEMMVPLWTTCCL